MAYVLIGSSLSSAEKWHNESLLLARMRGDKSQASWRSSHDLYGTVFPIDRCCNILDFDPETLCAVLVSLAECAKLYPHVDMLPLLDVVMPPYLSSADRCNGTGGLSIASY